MPSNQNLSWYEAVYGTPLDPSSKDGFLINSPLMPKAEIGRYVASQGIQTPQIFDTLNDALRSGDFITRSEHPVEYYGAAGLFESLPITSYAKVKSAQVASRLGNVLDRTQVDPATTSPLEMLESIIPQLGTISQAELEQGLRRLEENQVRTYAQLIGLDPTEFAKGLGYSYRQLLPGYNRTIVEDSAVPGRYHVLTKEVNAEGKTLYRNYAIIQPSGELISNGPKQLRDDLTERAQSDIGFYERIRSLPKFDPNHCPIIEFQTFEGENYFLQYHRTRDKDPATFALEPSSKPNTLNGLFCRGATPPEGITLQAHYYNSEYFKTTPIIVPPKGEAGFETGGGIFDELMSRKRQVALLNIVEMNNLSDRALNGHTPVSLLFNPQVSVALQYRELQDFNRRLYAASKESGNTSSVPIHITSDGTNATVEFLE